MTATPWLQRQHAASLVIFRALQIGDMLCAVPALRALRHAMLGRAHRPGGLALGGAVRHPLRLLYRRLHRLSRAHGLSRAAGAPARTGRFLRCMHARRFDIALQMHGSGEHSNLVVRAFGARPGRLWRTQGYPRRTVHPLPGG
ncbi:hypothetical protein LP419_21570 [Massilia sp. H-1]|nr:hypothetical protein LP419_21570 [Massilia sp. H-1]